MNVVLRIFLGLLNILYWLVYPVIWLRSNRKKQTVPRLSDELLKTSATDLAEKIRNKEVTSEKICAAYVKRIKEVNPIINAVVEERFNSALRDARNIDAYLQVSPLSNEELKKIKPLLGVPLTVKESCSLAGLSHCVGTLDRRGIKAHIDGDAVSRLRAGGAIPLLVSNTPELCLSFESSNFLTGATNNPYDTTRTSGGSSGGEGALLGSGASIIGVGSDIAGSIRIPALFNGIFGHKPTARIIPIKGHYPCSTDKRFADYLVVGPMARYAKDLKLMTKIMCNGKTALLNLDEKVDMSEIKVFYMEESGKSAVIIPVQDEIKKVIQKSVQYLGSKSGCQIQDFKFTELEDSLEIAGSLLYDLKDIPNLLKGQENHNLMIEFLKSLAGASKFTTNVLLFYIYQFIYDNLVTNSSYQMRHSSLRKLFIEVLGDNGVFLYPTFPTSAFKHNLNLFSSSGVSYLMIVNTLGLPATHVPCGLDKNGLPIGLQVIAAPNQDRLCFAVAEELEKCFGGWVSPGDS